MPNSANGTTSTPQKHKEKYSQLRSEAERLNYMVWFVFLPPIKIRSVPNGVPLDDGRQGTPTSISTFVEVAVGLSVDAPDIAFRTPKPRTDTRQTPTANVAAKEVSRSQVFRPSPLGVSTRTDVTSVPRVGEEFFDVAAACNVTLL